MFRKVVALLVVLAFAAPAAAAPITAASIAKAVKDVAQQERTTPQGKNPYLWPAVGMMGGGAAVAVFGLFSTHRTITLNCVYGSCTGSDITEHNRTGLGVAGLGIAGAGVALLLVGNSRRAAADVSFGPRSVTVTRTVTF